MRINFIGVNLKKIFIFLMFYPIFLFSGVFEHLLDKDKNYLFKHNFRCNESICITSEKNIFDNEIMDKSVKVIRVFLDHNSRVFKIEIELSVYLEKREAFYIAMQKSAIKTGSLEYSSYVVNDKYGNHSLIDIVDKKMRKNYIKHLTETYYNTMKSYKK
jgi:hypothetical protein